MTTIKIIEGMVTALSSISHIGETHSITSMLRREKIVYNEQIEEIPIYSGNALRGILRDVFMADMLKRIGFGPNKGIPLDIFFFLFSGGSLTKSSDAINIEKARKLRKTIPLVSLFGGSAGDIILPGKMDIGKLYPICEETKDYIPQRYTEKKLHSIWELIQQEAYTRRDDSKNDIKRMFLDEDSVIKLEQKDTQKSSKQTSGTNDKAVSANEQKQQMRYFVETFIPGTKFFIWFILKDTTAVEFEAFMTGLGAFYQNSVIGGKGNVGHGKIKIELDNWQEFGNTQQEQTGKVFKQEYFEHLEYLKNNQNLITELSNEL